MYIPFDPSVPEGAHTPPVYADEDLANIRALRDAVVCGFMPGWSFATVGGTVTRPQYYRWLMGVLGFRVEITYGPGPAFTIAGARWEYTENSGALWTVITTGGTAVAITTDAGTGMITAADKDAGMWVLILAALQRNGFGDSGLASHAAGVGAAVHGLGTISTQNANAVALTGGTESGVAVLLAPRLSPATPPVLVSGAAFDWSGRPTQVEIAAGSTINGLLNAVGGEMKRVFVMGAGPITITPGVGNTFTWAQGMPVWGTTLTILNIIARNPTTFYGTTIPV